MAKRFIDGQEITSSAFLEAVGTVSESGGVPTGAIIESGSNSNGNYIKYADGTMICHGIASTGSQTTNINFPATFSATPTGSYTLKSRSGVFPPNNYLVTTTIGGMSVYFSSVPNASYIYVHYMAIGRWY